ncbi:MAG: ABC-F family ATP-binding cassette domain-containing protein [Oscillospiraceae bacterium]|nr:ABC-F family ATP-binding cassette domain-containing protein [Oscillospiraceae bacterium]
MSEISIQGLVKAFEQDKNILDGLSFEINSGERVGILGKNGAGKTTLFRIITGEVRPDEGRVVIPSGRRIGLISQIPVFPDGYTVEDVLKSAHERIFQLEAKMNELASRMAGEASEAILREYDSAAAEYERLGGYSADSERSRVANGLEISEAMRKQLFSELSGGEKTRVNLARLILEDTDILLLDEPTNHLDLKATEWLEDYLLKFRGTVLAISHDRYFLDRVVTRTIEVLGGKAEFYSGNYSFYVDEKQRRYEEQLKKYEKEQAKIAQLQEAADKLHLWAFMGADKLHKRAFSMEKRMERMRQTDRPKAERTMKMRFAQREFSGDEVLVIDGVGKSFGVRTLFSDLELIIEGGEHIALIGDNGTGKSTLIKLIVGENVPDSGMIRRGPSVKTAYLPQIIKFDHPGRSLLDTMLYSEKCTPQGARDRLASFRFSGEDVFKPVSALSGGEQSRLRLCMLMRSDTNFLILDEPTNHLDIQSREWIEEAVDDYDEALLLVSHDRYFIERFATRIWALENGTITDFRGGFDDYREYLRRRSEQNQNLKQKENVKEDSRRAQRKNPSAYNEKQLQKTERDIQRLEEKLKEIELLCEKNSSDYQMLMELDARKAETQKELDGLLEKWEELSEQSLPD